MNGNLLVLFKNNNNRQVWISVLQGAVVAWCSSGHWKVRPGFVLL